jgi:hypothetical protein
MVRCLNFLVMCNPLTLLYSYGCLRYELLVLPPSSWRILTFTLYVREEGKEGLTLTLLKIRREYKR